MYRNCIVTGSNSKRDNRDYYKGLLSLVSSVNKWASELVEHILIFDFGLERSEINNLKEYNNVSILSIPLHIFRYFENMNIGVNKFYCYRAFILSEIIRKYALNVFWLDAGVCFVNDPSYIFKTIDEEGIFVVSHDGLTTRRFMLDSCSIILDASEEELDSNILFGGIVGFKTNTVYHLLFKEVYRYVCKRGVLIDDKKYSDQTVMSVLCSRYGIIPHENRKYAEHLGPNVSSDQVIYVHRCCNFSGDINEHDKFR